LNLVLGRLGELLLLLAEKIDTWADIPLIAFTHLQPAEPSTLGYRLAQYGQDLLLDWKTITSIQDNLRGKGFKGAVGTGASFAELIGVEHLPMFEVSSGVTLLHDNNPGLPPQTRLHPYQCISWVWRLASQIRL
jgi:adenylosuccinate lyase